MHTFSHVVPFHAHVVKGSYIFKFPDRRQCDNVRCEEGGTCVDTVDSYYCICLDGYRGRSCQYGKSLFKIVR